MNNKKKKKGFTMIELLIVVLIIGVLAGISLPIYFKAVEKSRAVESIHMLGNIAKAQQRNKLQNQEYTDSLEELDITIKPYTPENATENKFDTQYFDVELKNDYAIASRKVGGIEYSLMIDYETNKLYCETENSSICVSLGIEEGNPYVTWPQTEECNPTLYGRASGYYSCTRSIYKNGTKRDVVCWIGWNSCEVYDNDNNKVAYFDLGSSVTTLEGVRRQLIRYMEYDPDNSNKVLASREYYQDDGTIRGWANYNRDGSLKESGSASSYIQYSSEGRTNYSSDDYGWHYFDTYDNSNNKLVSKSYDEGGNLRSIKYYAPGSSSWIESINFNAAGQETSYNCRSGACAEEGYVKPTAEILDINNLPTHRTFCGDYSEDCEYI